MTENEMLVFKTLYEHKTATAAGKQLNFSQAYVSKVLKKMEEDLRVTLFVREKKKLIPTPDGRVLYIIICNIMKEFSVIDKTFNSIPEELTSLKILAPPYLSETVLPDTLPQFLKKHPGINPELRVFSTAFFKDLLASDPADIVITGSLLDVPGYMLFTDFTEELCFIVSEDSPLPSVISLEEMANQPILMRELSSSQYEELRLAFSRISRLPHVIMQSVSNIVLFQMARAGLGVAVVPYMLYSRQNVFTGIRTVQLENMSISRKLYLYVNEDRAKDPLVFAYLNTVSDYLASALGALKEEKKGRKKSR